MRTIQKLEVSNVLESMQIFAGTMGKEKFEGHTRHFDVRGQSSDVDEFGESACSSILMQREQTQPWRDF